MRARNIKIMKRSDIDDVIDTSRMSEMHRNYYNQGFQIDKITTHTKIQVHAKSETSGFIGEDVQPLWEKQ